MRRPDGLPRRRTKSLLEWGSGRMADGTHCTEIETRNRCLSTREERLESMMVFRKSLLPIYHSLSFTNESNSSSESEAREAAGKSDHRWSRNRGGSYRCRPISFCLLSTKNIICILVHRAQFLQMNESDLNWIVSTGTSSSRCSLFLSLSSWNQQPVESDRGRVSRSWNMAAVTTHNILTFFSSFFRP